MRRMQTWNQREQCHKSYLESWCPTSTPKICGCATGKSFCHLLCKAVPNSQIKHLYCSVHPLRGLGSSQNVDKCALCGSVLDIILDTVYLPESVQASRVGDTFWLHGFPVIKKANCWKHGHCSKLPGFTLTCCFLLQIHPWLCFFKSWSNREGGLCWSHL